MGSELPREGHSSSSNSSNMSLTVEGVNRTP